MLLGSTNYGKAVDMWSVGCILAEILTGRPLFPGKSTKNQVALVIEVSGVPKTSELNELKDKYNIATDESILPTKFTKKSLKSIVPGASSEAMDLLNKLLQFNPDNRPTVEQALEHPYVASFHKEDEEIVCEKKIVIPLDDNKKYKMEEYRQKLYEETFKRKIEIRKKLLESIKAV